jgi:hypothetical protein
MRQKPEPRSTPESTPLQKPRAGRRGRRSDAELLAELEAQLAEEKTRLEKEQEELRKRTEINPAVKKIPSLAKQLLGYAQFAMDNGRLDLSNMVAMFLAGLQRIHDTETQAAQAALDEIEGRTDGDSEADAEGQEPLDDEFRRERWR